MAVHDASARLVVVVVVAVVDLLVVAAINKRCNIRRRMVVVDARYCAIVNVVVVVVRFIMTLRSQPSLATTACRYYMVGLVGNDTMNATNGVALFVDLRVRLFANSRVFVLRC
jgi:hypothetical protein